MDEREVWNILGQMAKGLAELHSKKVFHRDLKSANIFLNKNGWVKIGDMNVSKISTNGLLHTQTGTPYYASPEVWRDQPYTNKSDIWSLGCILYEMCALKPPFRAENMEGLYKKVLRGVPDKMPGVYSKELTDIIRSMLQIRASARPSAEDILAHPSVQKHFEDRFLLDPEPSEESPRFLSTIKMPENVNSLPEILPSNNYEPLRLAKTEGISHSQKPRAPVSVFLSLELSDKNSPPGKEKHNENYCNKASERQLENQMLPALSRKQLKSLKHQSNVSLDGNNSVLLKVESRKLKKRMEQILLMKAPDSKENLKNVENLSPILPKILHSKLSDKGIKGRQIKNIKLEPIA